MNGWESPTIRRWVQGSTVSVDHLAAELAAALIEQCGSMDGALHRLRETARQQAASSEDVAAT